MSVSEGEMVPFEVPASRRWWRWFVRLLFLAGLAVAARYAWKWYRTPQAAPTIRSVRVRRGTIVQTTQATGRIVPREEVYVRPLVSGLLVELRVRPGTRVRRGEQLATVRIVADPIALGDAQGQVRLAQVRLTRAERELARTRTLSERHFSSPQELAQAQDDERLAREELANARTRAGLIAQGSTQAGARSTRVFAPIDGTVLAVPVAVGDYVNETGAFRDGTTIATIANMDDLLFKGQIEEAYVGQLQLGMNVRIRVGALPGRSMTASLQWVSPRATIESVSGAAPAGVGIVPVLTASTVGITRFELWARLQGDTQGIRAGFSASGEIELARREQALVVEEGVLRFEGERAFARTCAVGPSGREIPVRVGISDGVRIEVLEGLNEGACVLERTP